MKRQMTYILLRDNKEIGPLSLEELQRTGLKPDDLIWVEGQSVCWLNPGQINELKDLPSPISNTSHDNAENTAISYTAVKKEAGVNGSGNGHNDTPAFEDMDAYMPVAEEETIVKPVKSTCRLPKTAVAETKYAKPLDELKEMYAKTLEQRLKKKGFVIQIPPQVKKAGLYVGLIAAGVIAGVLINNKGDKKENNASAPVATSADDGSGTIPERSSTPQDTVLITAPPPLSTAAREEMQYPEDHRDDEISKPPVERKAEATTPVAKSNPVITEERTDKPVSRERESSSNALNEIRSLVAVKSNNYDVGSFGGIRNLQLTVSNDSKYTLDHVVVELQYLKPRDEFIKAENISFYAIGPNDTKTLAIPKSTRGVKVAFKILRIESKEMSNNTAGL